MALPGQITVEGFPNAGFLYVIWWSTITLKAGRTDNPKRRLKEHVNAAKKLGVTIDRFWVSMPVLDSIREERAILELMKSRYVLSGGSEFFKASYDESLFIEISTNWGNKTLARWREVPR